MPGFVVYHLNYKSLRTFTSQHNIYIEYHIVVDFVELNLVERLPSLELRVISVSFIAKKVVNTASQILWKIHNIIARYSKKNPVFVLFLFNC